MTREQVDAMVRSLDRLDMGTNDGDVVHGLQSTRSDALLASAISVPLYLIPH